MILHDVIKKMNRKELAEWVFSRNECCDCCYALTYCHPDDKSCEEVHERWLDSIEKDHVVYNAFHRMKLENLAEYLAKSTRNCDCCIAKNVCTVKHETCKDAFIDLLRKEI